MAKKAQSDDVDFEMGEDASKGKVKKEKAPKEKKPREKKEKPPKAPREKKEKVPKEKKEKKPREPGASKDIKVQVNSYDKTHKTTMLGFSLRYPDKLQLSLHNPGLKATFLPLLLLLLAGGIIFLINDVIVILRTLIDANQFAKTNKLAYWNLLVIWYSIGLIIGLALFIRLITLKPRKAAKEGDWSKVFRKVRFGKEKKIVIPELLLWGIIIYVFNWMMPPLISSKNILGWDGFETSAVFILIAGLLIPILFKDDDELKLDKNEVWDNLTHWIKGFSLIGTLIIILSLFKQIVNFIGVVITIKANNIVGATSLTNNYEQGDYLAINLVFLIVTALLIVYYLIPFFLALVLEDKYEKITQENLIIVNFKLPILLIFIGWILIFQYATSLMPAADWGTYLLACSFIMIYIYAPFEITYFEHPLTKLKKKTPEEKDAARKAKEERDAQKAKEKAERDAQREKERQERDARKEKERQENEAEKARLAEEKAKANAEAQKEVPAPKPEPKKEAPKPEPKKEEAKPEPKKEEPKPEPKKEEPKPEPKKEAPKPELENDKEGEIEDKAEQEDVDAFPSIKDDFMALFDKEELYATKTKMIEAINTLNLPEGMTAEEALDIAKDQGLVQYSSKAPRGWSKV
jgi:hypothetical protein